MTAIPATGKGTAMRIEVRRLLGYILRRPIEPEEDPSRSTVPEWDSLKHVELMFLLEDHFHVRFSEQQMADMQDTASIVRTLETLGAA